MAFMFVVRSGWNAQTSWRTSRADFLYSLLPFCHVVSDIFFNSANALELRITTGGHVCCLIATKWRNFLKYFTKMSSLVPFAPAVSEGRIKCEKVTMTDDEWRFMVAKGHELISSTRLYHLKWEVCIYRTFQQRTYQCPQRENSTSYLNL